MVADTASGSRITLRRDPAGKAQDAPRTGTVSKHPRGRWIARGSAIASLFVSAAYVRAIDEELLRCSDSGALAAYWLDPAPSSDEKSDATGDSGSILAYMVESAQHMGLLSKLAPEERAWLDGFATMAVLRQFAHAVILIDARSETREDGGEQLSGVRAALVIRTEGRNAPIERVVQNWLSAYTNDGVSELAAQPGEDGEVFTLRDRRLPSWAPIGWGPVRSMYVIAIGTEVFPAVAARIRATSPETASHGWLEGAFKKARAGDAGFALYLNVDAIHRAANPSLRTKIGDVQGGLRLSDTQRALWTLGTEDRSIEVRSVQRIGDQDVVRVVADPAFLDRFGAGVVPKEATRFAIVDWNPGAAFETVCETVLAVESSASRRADRAFWSGVEAESGVHIGADIFGRMGTSLLIHDYPKHAFGLPLGVTLVAPIREDAAPLRRSIDRLLSHLDDRYLSLGGCFRLRKDTDGIWAIDFGLQGPAIGVNEDWIVVSFSPYGVRENLTRLPKRQRAASVEPRPTPR